MNKRERLSVLQALNEQCRACFLIHSRNKLVFGEGDPDCNLMFIAEAPGRTEDEQGRPLIGRSGTLLRNLITAIGIKVENVYLANICKCRPPKNRTPEDGEIEICIKYLKKQIEIISPKFLILLGKTAVRGLLPEFGSKPVNYLRAVSKENLLKYENIPVIVTYHPSALLYDPSKKSLVADDFRYIQAVMQ